MPACRLAGIPYAALVPFTLAHPAAVLLLRGTPFPVAAMVAGSMSPDVPMFLRLRGFYDLTHSPVGVLTVDLAMSFVAVTFWFALLRDPLVDICPAPVRERLAATARYDRRQWALVAPAAILGALTHITWDAFTHTGRWGVRWIDWLGQVHHGHTGADWAQFGSSIGGLAVVAAWALVAVSRLPRAPRPPTVPALGSKALAVVVALTAASGVAAAMATAAPGLGHWLAQASVVGTMILAFSVVVVAGLWQALASLLPE